MLDLDLINVREAHHDTNADSGWGQEFKVRLGK